VAVDELKGERTMFTFRAKYTSKGETKSSRKWYVAFDAPDGRQRRIPTGMVNRKNADGFGRRLDELAGAVAAHEPLPPGLSAWLESLPATTVEKLRKWNMLSSVRTAAGKRLLQHVEDWRRELESKGRTAKHVAMSVSHVQRIIDECGFAFWTDITADAVTGFLLKLADGLPTGKRKVKPASARTINTYLVSAKAFGRWMTRAGRAAVDPLAYLEPRRVAGNRKHIRRALLPEEISFLLHVVESLPERHGLTGASRSLLYRLCIESGLRASEARSLTRESFHLAGEAPTVAVDAAYTKNSKDDMLPLREATVALLREALAATPAGGRLFTFHKFPQYAKMLQRDLADARAKWLEEAADDEAERERREGTDFLLDVDSTGRVLDFHSLRHSFASLLASGNVHPRVAQSLLRHSDINLTMSVYTHPYAEQRADAVDKLPSFDAPAESESDGQAKAEGAGQ